MDGVHWASSSQYQGRIPLGWLVLKCDLDIMKAVVYHADVGDPVSQSMSNARYISILLGLLSILTFSP